MATIYASLFKSMEATFYETLKNYMDTVMTDEHTPIKALINILLSSISSTTNLMSLDESQMMGLWSWIF